MFEMTTEKEISTKTPASHGYYMPAEWEEHEATWLQWPNNEVEPGYEMKQERIWLEMTAALFECERVNIIVGSSRQREHVAYLLNFFGIAQDNVNLYIIPTNDLWARDNGPIFLINGQAELAISNWEFNGWGNRFEHDLDDRVPKVIGEQLSIPVFDAQFVLEGGAVEVNGQGTFVGTRSSIIDPFRNPGKKQAKIEEILCQYLGVSHFIWLSGAGRGECEKWGDTTDSHIDIVARFTGESTVLFNWTDDRADPRYSMFVKHEQELRTAVVLDADGEYLGKYRKMHIPEDPLYYEKFYFAPGDLGYRTFKTRYATIGVLICWDQWFPEAARLTALNGAESIFYPTAIGFTPPEVSIGDKSYRHAWQIVQQGHAVANSCFVAAVNRVGFEENPAGPAGIDF